MAHSAAVSWNILDATVLGHRTLPVSQGNLPAYELDRRGPVEGDAIASHPPAAKIRVDDHGEAGTATSYLSPKSAGNRGGRLAPERGTPHGGEVMTELGQNAE